MKKVFIFLFFTTLAFFQLNCTKTATDNAVQTNDNPAAQTNQANANVKNQATPLPIFTNADDALAEGKKLLDALETEKAIDALEQAVKLDPDLAEAYFNLGIAYALVEKDEAEIAKEEIEPTPTPKPSRKGKKESNKLVVDLSKNSAKAFDNAVKAYKKILAKNPKDDVAQFNLGRALNKLNEDEDAEKALREAVKLKPDDAEYQTEYGAILMKLAHYDQAVAALKKADNLDSDNVQIQDMLEKAEAGQKRVGFSSTPKPTPVTRTKPRDDTNENANVANKTNAKPKVAPTVEKKNANR
ncbi:MAG: tetratricopeptide repeat protein [Pyrinomonadaceae bacterium]